ncbi:hypothetical protein QQ045_032403 [Rhodiola kirilowii]
MSITEDVEDLNLAKQIWWRRDPAVARLELRPFGEKDSRIWYMFGFIKRSADYFRGVFGFRLNHKILRVKRRGSLRWKLRPLAKSDTRTWSVWWGIVSMAIRECLHGDVGPSSPLTWEIRMKIAIGTAKGVAEFVGTTTRCSSNKKICISHYFRQFSVLTEDDGFKHV